MFILLIEPVRLLEPVARNWWRSSSVCQDFVPMMFCLGNTSVKTRFKCVWISTHHAELVRPWISISIAWLSHRCAVENRSRASLVFSHSVHPEFCNRNIVEREEWSSQLVLKWRRIVEWLVVDFFLLASKLQLMINVLPHLCAPNEVFKREIVLHDSRS